MASVKEIDALLPQTQCGQCSYAGCLPYAEALSQGQVAINKCPPGGLTVLHSLATLLNVDVHSYLQEGIENLQAPATAIIREDECIGCTKCIQACPVDAIIGGAKLMHAVLSHECTGCGLCVAPCPVDCIEIAEIPEPLYEKNLARTRFNAKKMRLLRDEHQKQQAYREKRSLALQSENHQDIQAKQDYIQLALARVKAKQAHE